MPRHAEDCESKHNEARKGQFGKDSATAVAGAGEICGPVFRTLSACLQPVLQKRVETCADLMIALRIRMHGVVQGISVQEIDV